MRRIKTNRRGDSFLVIRSGVHRLRNVGGGHHPSLAADYPKVAPSARVVHAPKCRLANARPEPDFRYFSKRIASRCWEFDGNNDRPWPGRDGMTGWTAVIPVQAIPHVTGNAYIVARGVSVTSNDVNDPFFDAIHTCSWRHAPGQRRIQWFWRFGSGGTQFCRAG